MPPRTLTFLTLLTALTPKAHSQTSDWLAVGGDRGATRYSALDQIHKHNVAQLQVAWTYHTGELENKRGKIIECTPIVIEGVMYVTTAYLKVVALDARTGGELWTFDPFGETEDRKLRAAGPLQSGGVNRGAAYWSDGTANGERRILHGTADGRLLSLDARTGKLDPNFGEHGIVDLHAGLEERFRKLGYGPTSAPAIFENLVILGFSCGEGPGIAAPGDVRAFDVRTGREAWRFHTVPRKNEPFAGTWQDDSNVNRGAANAWGGVSVDTKRGFVYFGLGSAAFDFYGGDRKGQNHFANSVVCVDGRTGKRRWHFQTLHHDLWDHDLPIYPNLVTVTHDDKRIDAAAQVTKTGYVYLFDRVTGKPLFTIEERPVPASDVPGEEAWPTQPIPVKPPPFARTTFHQDDVTDISAEARAYVLERLKTLKAGPSLPATIARRNRHRPRVPRRRDLVGRQLRPRNGNPLRQREQRPQRQPADPRRRGQTLSLSLRWLQTLPRPRRLPRDQATLGHLDRHRPAPWRPPLAGPPRRPPRTRETRHPPDRNRELRWHDRDPRRTRLHRRHEGRTLSRLLQGYGRTPVGNQTQRRRLCHAVYVRGGWHPVRHDRGRWRRQTWNQGWRRLHHLRTASERAEEETLKRHGKPIPWVLLTITFLLLGTALALYLHRDLIHLLFDASVSSADKLAAIKERFLSYGALAPFLYTLIVIVEVVIAPIPGMFLYLPGGAIFGGLLGGTLALIGNVLGAGLAALFMRSLVSKQRIDKGWESPRMWRLQQLIEKHGLLIVILLRLNPATSSDLVSYAAAFTPMRVPTLMLGTLIGMAPLCYAQSYLVSSIFTAFPWLLWPMVIAFFVYVAVVCWVLASMQRGSKTLIS